MTGNPETKELKDMMPEILKQVGPQQYSFLKDLMKNVIPEGKAAEEDEDDVPELVGTFEDASKKWAAMHWADGLLWAALLGSTTTEGCT